MLSSPKAMGFFVVKNKRGPIFRLVNEFFTQNRRTLLVLVLCVAIMAAADITVPFITQKLIDGLIAAIKSGQALPFGFLGEVAAGILLATVTSRVFHSLYNYRLFVAVTRFEDKLRFRAYETYLRLHVLYHYSVSSGQMVGRIDRGATGVYAILNDVIGQYLLPPAVIFVGVMSVLLYWSPLVALVVVLPLPVYIVFVRKLSQRVYEIEALANDQFENAIREEYDVAANVLTVKKFAKEQAEIQNQQAMRRLARHTQYSGERVWALVESLQTTIATVGRVAVIALASWLVIAGKASIGQLVFFVTLQNMAYQPLSQLSVAFPRARRNAARAERLFRVIDEERQVVDKPNAKNLPALEQEIKFDEVYFQFPEKRGWALQDITAAIPARSVVAIVGRSGSGKSTFINLLLRSFDPRKGTVSIDGYDLRDVKQDSLRRQIAIVPQEVDLFSRTIAENIKYGKPEATRAEIMAAAKQALAHDFILAMPRGYETLVGERGLKLSGGERQRVGIARAVIKKPTILILDEATSHLDTESERLVQTATEALMKTTTTIVIAHRLSTVLRADKILVFDRGKIVGEGRHRELLDTNPVYRRLYEMQFQDE